MPAFNELFNPFRGDIVYGTTEARASYLEDYLESHEAEELQNDHARVFGVYDRGYYINDYNEPIADGDYRDLDDPVIQVGPVSHVLDARFRERQIAYLGAIRRSRYTPANVGRATSAALAKGDVRLNQMGPQPTDRVPKAAMVLAIRRACKFGIEYVLDTFPHAYVHYILDGISMDEVLSKAERNLFTGTGGVPITTSELRFLFRNWNRLKTRHILFYLDGNVVQPPWQTRPDQWLPYAVSRATKYRDELNHNGPSKLKWFDAAADGGNANDALHWFFGFTPYGGQV